MSQKNQPIPNLLPSLEGHSESVRRLYASSQPIQVVPPLERLFVRVSGRHSIQLPALAQTAPKAQASSTSSSSSLSRPQTAQLPRLGRRSADLPAASAATRSSSADARVPTAPLLLPKKAEELPNDIDLGEAVTQSSQPASRKGRSLFFSSSSSSSSSSELNTSACTSMCSSLFTYR